MRFFNIITKSFIALILAVASSSAFAGPGCVGKMWNPISDIDFRLMGGIRIAGIPLLKDPSHLGRPPKHRVSTVCFCKDGWKTGFGLGLTYWLPTYIADIARQAGCIGFLNGTNILPGFIAQSSGQEYNVHSPAKEGVTSMQVHWAYADITAIAGNELFESCQSLSSEFSIAYMTEVDFVFQNDVYSAIMTPQVALLSSNALLSQMSCGLESVANTLGGWQDYGICGWKGTRLPLSANSISKDMAQVSNMDVALKYLTRSALTGTMLRTIGKDVACMPKWSPFYDPFQHRYQWSYPAKVSTRYNVDVLRWGLFIKPEGMMGGGMKELGPSTSQVQSQKPGENKASPGVVALSKKILASIPKPLNYPTHESGYMQVWEAKTCCLMLLTVESVAKKLAEGLIPDGLARDLYDAYTFVEKAYSFISDPIGTAFNMIGEGIASVFESTASFVGDVAGNLFGAAPVNEVFAKGPSAGLANSIYN